MPFCDLGGFRLHFLDEGPKDGPVVVFSNSLGTTTAMWELVVPHLPTGLRIIRYDKRGHGRSAVPTAPYSMGGLVRDVEQLLDYLEVKDVVFVGLSIGGMIGQGLAAKRLDLVRAMVLSNTGAKIGTRQMWQDRIDMTLKQGMPTVAPQIMKRWFGADSEPPEFAGLKQALEDQNPEGYTGCAAAIQGTDLITPTSGLRLPVLGIAGGRDAATPADMVRELCDLIPGSKMRVLSKSGHIPAIDAPLAYAEILTEFLTEIGHLPTTKAN